MIVSKEPAGTTQQKIHPSLPESSRLPRSTGRPRSWVLIVDDDVELVSRYQRALEACGYVVDRSSRGELPLRLPADNHYDVVVGDVDPDDDSTFCCLRGRCPLVLLSQGLAFASALAAVRYGVYRYLLKPVSEDRLLEVLVETIRERSPRMP